MNFRFRDLREDAGLAQKEVAAMLKCDQSLYSKYERGVREMPMRDVIFLAKYFLYFCSQFLLLLQIPQKVSF